MSIRTKLSSYLYPKEVHLAEQFNFGHREILLVANELPSQSIFLASIQHGWCTIRTQAPIKNRKFSDYPTVVWSQRIAFDLKQKGVSNVLVGGSPWSHLLRACKVEPKISSKKLDKGRSFLLFPSHSIPEALSESVPNLQRIWALEDIRDITVCLFWLDFVDPAIRNFYVNLGCKVTCVGSKGNSALDTPWSPVGGRLMFTPNLLDLINSHDVIGVGGISTPFWYALSLGKNVYIDKDTEDFKVWSTTGIRVDKYPYKSETLMATHSLPEFLYRQEITCTQELLDLSLEELGWSESLEFSRNLDSKLMTTSKIDASLVAPIADYVNNCRSQ
jgi:hypothetical protein